MSEIYYEHYGSPPIGFAVTGVTPGYLSLRVSFTKGVVRTDFLLDPASYNIVVDTPTTAFDFKVTSVTPELNVAYPTYIDLIMTDCTHGADYQFEVTSGSLIESEDSTPMEPDFLSVGASRADFVGVSELPEVLSVIPQSLSQVKVVFTKSMMQNTDLYTPGKYVWTGGVSTVSVDKDTNSSVILTTTEMIASQIYDLTVG